MSIHINAPQGAIAPAVLLPGDPLRAKFIAENFLENPKCYNEVRGMLGFTGTYKGVPVSVQGTGMGHDSYGVQKAVRVGTCGGLREDINVRDTIIASAACSESAMQNSRFGHLHYAPAADFGLLKSAYDAAQKLQIPVHVGLCASSDAFYDENDYWKLWAKYGVLGLEMEAAELYTLAAKFRRKALAILTVSDHLVTHELTTAEERQTTFTNMMKIALEAIISES